MAAASSKPLVGIIMGSKSDLPILQNTCDTLTTLGVPFEIRVVSAHRTPEAAIEYARTAETRGLKVIIAAAGGAAHLPGVAAALTALPVIGIPIESASLKGLDSLLSIVQMPAGVPVATVAIGKPGAINAAILASQIIATASPEVAKALRDYRAAATQKILNEKIELPAKG